MESPLIVIPTLTASLVENCLNSLRNVKSPHEVVVVDNAGGVTFKNVIRGDDWSFSKSCNEGARWSEGDLVLLNDDIIAHDDFLLPMREIASGDIGVVGALLLYPSGLVQHAGASYNNGNPCHPHKGKHPASVPYVYVTREVELVTFACVYIRRECWEDLGGLDESYPLGYEDVDFCLRARKKGWKIYYCAEARLTHLEHTTQKRRLKVCREKSNESLELLRERWGCGSG